MSCDDGSCRSLAKRMKAEDPDQFQTLVRMHLSFVLHLTLSDTEVDGSVEKTKVRPLKWGIAPFTKKLKNLTKEATKDDEVPSTPLTRKTVVQVNKLISYISKEENLVQEGLFRRSGKLTRQQELKASLVDNGNVDFNSYSIHDVASVLKNILAELPEPLLTEIYYPAYCQIADLCSGSDCSNHVTRVLRSLQLLFLLLPRENRRLLKYLLRLLHSTALHESSNRMSPQNLATLFTPHLLCSRKLSPEAFHSIAQNLSCVVVFMINQSSEMFVIPEALATDIHAYWEGKRKNTFLERSISEAKTVFSFTDRELSQREDAVNPTETALAQLYAHIQSLPESSHKKRLIKQFNKENGNGTPRTKSLGVTIKKHIFSKHSKSGVPYLKANGMASSTHSLLNSPERKIPRTPLTAKLRLNLRSCSDGKGSDRRSPSIAEDEANLEGSESSLSTTGSSMVNEEGRSMSPSILTHLHPLPPGSNDNSQKQETSSCVERLEHRATQRCSLVVEREIVGTESRRHTAEDESKTGGGRERVKPCQLKGRGNEGRRGRRLAYVSIQGLSFQSQCSYNLPSRSEFFVEDRGFRPLVVHRQRKCPALRFTSPLPRRGFSIIDQEFWVPPEKGAGPVKRPLSGAQEEV